MPGLRFLTPLVALAALAACSDRRLSEAQELVSRDMLDPSSAQFRNVEAKEQAICGEVNGKNAYGAYTGFKRFAVFGGKAVIEEAQSDQITEVDRYNNIAAGAKGVIITARCI